MVVVLIGWAVSHSFSARIALLRVFSGDCVRFSNTRRFLEVQRVQQIQGNVLPTNPYGGERD